MMYLRLRINAQARVRKPDSELNAPARVWQPGSELNRFYQRPGLPLQSSYISDNISLLSFIISE